MYAYVKSASTYRTTKKLTALSWSLIPDSLEDESSSVTVKGGECNSEDTGNWLIIDGLVFLISKVTPQETSATLALSSPLNAFKRPLELSQQPERDTIGAFVASVMQRNWIQCEDPVYAIWYLTVSSTDRNGYVPPALDSSGCFSLADYCRLMRKSYCTRVAFRDGGSSLQCVIDTFTPAFRQVSFQDGRSQLIQAEFSSSGYGKITALVDLKTGEKDSDGKDILIRERHDWYLSETGEVSQTVPDRRAPGTWGTVAAKSLEEMEQKVVETFAKNAYSHKVEFYSNLELNVQDSCRLWVRGREVASMISSKRRQSGASRFYYKAGLLATTATEKLRRNRE